MIPVTAKNRFFVSGYMDFQPTAQPLVAGVGLVAESTGWICGVGRAGGTGEGRREPVHGGLAAASMPRTPSPAPPARPLTHCGGPPATERKKKSKSKNRSHAPSSASRSDRSHPRIAWIDRVDQGRHLPTAAGNCRRWGGVGWQDRWRHGWRHRAPRDGFTACPASPHRPAQPTETRSRFGFGFGFGLCGCRVQPCRTSFAALAGHGPALPVMKKPPFGGFFITSA
jgi:hypothetical protein